MIRQMIHLDPSTRPTFETILQTSRGTVFPESFYSFLHHYVSSVNDPPSSSPFAPPISLASGSSTPITAASSASVTIRGSTMPRVPQTTVPDFSNSPLPGDSDQRIERIWAEFESIEPYITVERPEDALADPSIGYATAGSTSRLIQVSTDSSQ